MGIRVIRANIGCIALACLLSLFVSEAVQAQTIRKDSVKIYFRQGYSVLDKSIRDNDAALDRIADSLRYSNTDSVYRLEKVLVVGGASPEGTIKLNHRLSRKRADVLFDYLSRYGTLPDSLTTFNFLGRDFYMAVKTNMLYDALLVPNIGVEFYLGKNWSIAGDWMYAWWKKDRIQWYWRTYGGGLTVRKWFGKKADEKPLTGHHLGIYGQALTYDIEMGNRGYIGGVPGGDLFDKANFTAGVEYGYSLPIRSRLNIDFTLGIGYFGGKYYKYIPIDNCYVWQETRMRNYFGPTRLEVSLVWLIGRGNYNKDKKGRR